LQFPQNSRLDETIVVGNCSGFLWFCRSSLQGLRCEISLRAHRYARHFLFPLSALLWLQPVILEHEQILYSADLAHSHRAGREAQALCCVPVQFHQFPDSEETTQLRSAGTTSPGLSNRQFSVLGSFLKCLSFSESRRGGELAGKIEMVPGDLQVQLIPRWLPSQNVAITPRNRPNAIKQHLLSGLLPEHSDTELPRDRSHFLTIQP
jgi:hypothetical protein